MTGHRTLRRTLPTILAALALVTGSETATADEERWECCHHRVLAYCNPEHNEIVLKLQANRAKMIGRVKIGDVVDTSSVFVIQGLARRWVWGRSVDDTEYQIIMKLNDEAGYYDFTDAKDGEKRTPKETFTCVKLGTQSQDQSRRPSAGATSTKKRQLEIDLDKLPQRTIRVEPHPTPPAPSNPTPLTPLIPSP